MPCRGPEPDEIYHMNKSKIKRLRTEVDSLTRWLCWIIREWDIPCVELELAPIGEGDTLVHWWRGHKKLDEERAKKEKQEKIAKKKALELLNTLDESTKQELRKLI